MWSPPRTALVTGANRGIGLAIAQGLVARGDVRVLAAARRMEDARAAAAAVGAEPIELDLTNPVDAETTAAWIETTHGDIDILVNNAAVLVSGNGLQVSTEAFVDSLAVNTVAPFALMRALGPGMQARGWGRIVNLTSGWGAFAEGMAGPAAYATSKAALNAVTCSFARSLGPSVKVNAACPGWVRTRMGGSEAPRSPEQGADTPIWLATLPDEGPTGGVFRDRTRVEW